MSEIGCIHTCQGLELDCVGVITRPDLVVRDGKALTRAEERSKHRRSNRSYMRMVKADPEPRPTGSS